MSREPGKCQGSVERGDVVVGAGHADGPAVSVAGAVANLLTAETHALHDGAVADVSREPGKCQGSVERGDVFRRAEASLRCAESLANVLADC